MNIIVLCGGLSSERDVSLSSGTNVARELKKKGHNAVLVDLYFGYTETYDDPKEIFTRDQDELIFSVGEDEPDLERIKAMRVGQSDSIIGENVLEVCKAADVTFLALHGEEGENGKLQAIMDMEHIKYTGSGYLGSAVAMNKSLSKKLFIADGIGTPDGITVEKGKIPYADAGFPCVVKPCSGGSSVGTTIAHSGQEYGAALELAFKYGDQVIVEKYIGGREFTCGVLGGKAMPVIEIIPKTGFYDYKNKYQAGATKEICPAEIPDEDTQRIQRLSERVFNTLLIDSYCRVDLRMDENGELYCLEANTLPGMTPTSLIPQMGAAMGMDYGTLCEKIIEASLEKRQ